MIFEALPMVQPYQEAKSASTFDIPATTHDYSLKAPLLPIMVLLLSPAIIAIDMDIEDRHLYSATSPHRLQNLFNKQRKTRCVKDLKAPPYDM